MHILQEWTSTAPYSNRVQNLLTGSGPCLNGIMLEPGVTVFDDDDVDTLAGGSETDLFFANLVGTGVLDEIDDLTPPETLVEL